MRPIFGIKVCSCSAWRLDAFIVIVANRCVVLLCDHVSRRIKEGHSIFIAHVLLLNWLKFEVCERGYSYSLCILLFLSIGTNNSYDIPQDTTYNSHHYSNRTDERWGGFGKLKCLCNNSDVLSDILNNYRRRDGHVNTNIRIIHQFNVLKFRAVGYH